LVVLGGIILFALKEAYQVGSYAILTEHLEDV
jgi:hypothetical protein